MMRSTKENTMKKTTAISCVFLDIGGVLPTNGWDHLARKRAATNFKLEWTEMEDRHGLNFSTYQSTYSQPASFGLQNDEEVSHETR
jgi:hypothetical protein